MQLVAYFFFVVVEDVPVVVFMFLVFTRMPGGVTVGDSGLCCCVSCVFDGMLETPNSKVRRVFLFPPFYCCCCCCCFKSVGGRSSLVSLQHVTGHTIELSSGLSS